jgi:nicotinamidase-related amidase
MALTLDPRATALVIIDLQNSIVARQLAPHDPKTVVRNAVRIGQALAKAGGLIVPVHVAFAADHADRLQQPADAAIPSAPPTPGAADLVPEVAALPAPFVVTKHQWGAFYGTELDLQLRRRGIRTIILCGIATNFGVESTARDAWERGYELVIVEDACTSMGDGAHEFPVRNIFPRLGRVRSTAEVLAVL